LYESPDCFIELSERDTADYSENRQHVNNDSKTLSLSGHTIRQNKWYRKEGHSQNVYV